MINRSWSCGQWKKKTKEKKRKRKKSHGELKALIAVIFFPFGQCHHLCFCYSVPKATALWLQGPREEWKFRNVAHSSRRVWLQSYNCHYSHHSLSQLRENWRTVFTFPWVLNWKSERLLPFKEQKPWTWILFTEQETELISVIWLLMPSTVFLTEKEEITESRGPRRKAVKQLSSLGLPQVYGSSVGKKFYRSDSPD